MNLIYEKLREFVLDLIFGSRLLSKVLQQHGLSSAQLDE
jgi:hypothetical protein